MWTAQNLHHKCININVHWLCVLEKVEPGSTSYCVFLQVVTLLLDYLLNIITNKYFLAVVILCAIVSITAALSSYFFTAAVCFNESRSRGDSKFTHFQSQNEEVTEALVKSIAISQCPFRLDSGEYLETQSRAGLMTFRLLSTQSYVKWDRRMDLSSQWLAKWFQRHRRSKQHRQHSVWLSC